MKPQILLLTMSLIWSTKARNKFLRMLGILKHCKMLLPVKKIFLAMLFPIPNLRTYQILNLLVRKTQMIYQNINRKKKNPRTTLRINRIRINLLQLIPPPSLRDSHQRRNKSRSSIFPSMRSIVHSSTLPCKDQSGTLTDVTI